MQITSVPTGTNKLHCADASDTKHDWSCCLCLWGGGGCFQRDVITGVWAQEMSQFRYRDDGMYNQPNVSYLAATALYLPDFVHRYDCFHITLSNAKSKSVETETLNTSSQTSILTTPLTSTQFDIFRVTSLFLPYCIHIHEHLCRELIKKQKSLCPYYFKRTCTQI